MQGEESVELREFLPQRREEKIPALPLEFEYYPVEVLSKEFTKLNSPHPYRIHYLGPRPLNSLILHKRLSRAQEGEGVRAREGARAGEGVRAYQMELRKIINCNFTNERLQQNHHYRSAIFYRAFEGMNPTLPLANEFVFNSAFESGNLDCVIKVRPCEFDLFLRIDSNTRGHTSWYYFSVRNGAKTETVTLNICNLTKPNALYDQGLRPFVLSRLAGRGWEQAGENCRFEQANLRYDIVYEEASIPPTYRLSFEYRFEHPHDEVYFAYCVPYTYSQLQADVDAYRASPYARAETLGKSLTGVELPVLHITNHAHPARKKNIVVTGRVHPCETNSSHMLRGFISFLLSEAREAEELRAAANFFIVPMLNPDGVILGNSRTSVSGKDLNRQFMSFKKQLYPEVLLVKTLAAKLQRKHGVFTYLDFHGHSRRKNTFLYGPNYPMSHSGYYKCRVLPRLIEKCDPRFRFYSCSFMISEEKKTTARAVTLSQLKIPYSYTIESSIGLYYNPAIMKTETFTQSSWEEMGQSIALGLFHFVSAYIDHEAMLRDRKLQRAKKEPADPREQKGAKLSKLKEEEGEKGKRGSAFAEMLEEVRAASEQVKKWEEEVESDDQDEREELEGYKLIEFNNMVTKGIQRHKNHGKAHRQEEIDFEAIVCPQDQPEDDEPADPRPPPQDSPKKQSQISKYAKPEEPPRKDKKFIQVTSSNRLQESDSKKFSLSENKTRTSEQKDRSFKNFVLKNKERYSIPTKNIFPVEDKCEILALPRNIQVMRKSMKKGRLLINNLEESRLRFFSLGLKEDSTLARRDNRIPFLQMDKLRNPSKLSTGAIKLAAEDINLNDFRVRKSQSHFHEVDAYTTLNGFEMDNRAMTITAFKQLK